MSLASERGKTFEQLVAKMIRQKTGKRAVRDSKSGALWNRPSDISTDLPDVHIECKDHETVKVKEWMRQATEAASFNQKPIVAFRMDEDVLTIMRLGDVLDLFKEAADLRAELNSFRQPVRLTFDDRTYEVGVEYAKSGADKSVCRNGHIVTSNGKCLTKGCPFSQGYKPKKKKP